MPIIIFETLEEVPEFLRDSATEKNGKYEADASGVLNKNTELLGKVAALKTFKTNYETLQTKLGDYDLDELIEAKATLEKQPKKKNDSSETTEELFDKWQKKNLQPILEQNQKLSADLTRLKLDDKVRASALANGVSAKYIDDVMETTRKRFKLGEGDKITILDADGDPTATELNDFWGKNFKEEKPIYYPPSGAGGSGGTGSGAALGKANDVGAGVPRMAQAYADGSKTN